MNAIKDITDPGVRLEVYEEALRSYLNRGLCFILRDIAVGGEDNLWRGDNGWFSVFDVHFKFPEFAKYYPSSDYSPTPEYRAQILTTIIADLKKTLKQSHTL